MRESRPTSQLLKEIQERNNPKTTLASKKASIAKKLSPRMQEIKENNERSHRENSAMIARSKHEMKSDKSKRPTLASRIETVKRFSKD